MIQEHILTTHLTQHERETHFYLEGNHVICDSTIPKHFNRCIKRGWTPVNKTLYEDGTICGMVLMAPAKALSIRNVKALTKTLTEEQKTEVAERLKQGRKSIQSK